MSSRKMPQHCTWGKWNPIDKDQLQKGETGRCIGGALQGILGDWMYEKEKKHFYQMTFVFVFRPKMNVLFRFRFVFGRKWNFIFVGIFVYGRKWKMLFDRPVVYGYTSQKRSWSWDAKSWSWSWNYKVFVLILKKSWLHQWILDHFIRCLLLSALLKEFWKSVNIWES